MGSHTDLRNRQAKGNGILRSAMLNGRGEKCVCHPAVWCFRAFIGLNISQFHRPFVKKLLRGKIADNNSLKLFIPVVTKALNSIMSPKWKIFCRNQPSLWSCPADPLSIDRIANRSSQCKVLCGTVSQCLSAPQTLYWPTREAPVGDSSECRSLNVTARSEGSLNSARCMELPADTGGLPDSSSTPRWTCRMCSAAAWSLAQSSCTCGRAKEQIRSRGFNMQSIA